jgi:hypothetical protein
MHRSEARDLVQCASCRAEISLGRDRGYPVTADSALCFACAVERGGRYDAQHDAWDPGPRLEGLRVLEDLGQW